MACTKFIKEQEKQSQEFDTETNRLEKLDRSTFNEKPDRSTFNDDDEFLGFIHEAVKFRKKTIDDLLKSVGRNLSQAKDGKMNSILHLAVTEGLGILLQNTCTQSHMRTSTQHVAKPPPSLVFGCQVCRP